MMKKMMTMAVALLVWSAAAMAQQHIKVQGAVGQLDTEVMKPAQLKAGEKCPVVIMMHGFGGRKEGQMYDRLSQELLAKGVAVVRFDFNGHGQSEGDFRNHTVPNEIEDAKAIIKYVEGLDFTQNVSLVGHSQGGVVVGMTAGELGADRIKRVVMSAPAAVLREDALRGSTMGKQYNPREYKDVEMFGGRFLGGEYIRTAQTLPIFQTTGKYTGPVLLVHGTFDVVAPPTFSEYYSFVLKNCEVKYVEGADHGFGKHLDEWMSHVVAFLTK